MPPQQKILPGTSELPLGTEGGDGWGGGYWSRDWVVEQIQKGMGAEGGLDGW